jgi:hypothetical protein
MNELNLNQLCSKETMPRYFFDMVDRRGTGRLVRAHRPRRRKHQARLLRVRFPIVMIREVEELPPQPFIGRDRKPATVRRFIPEISLRNWRSPTRSAFNALAAKLIRLNKTGKSSLCGTRLFANDALGRSRSHLGRALSPLRLGGAADRRRKPESSGGGG